MEKLRTFDENYHYMCDENRDRVHRDGLWHETFQCWFVDDEFIYIQKRSEEKKDFPSLFDITAAGHLEAHEIVSDGVREIAEELGIKVDFSSLQEVGVVRDVIELPNFHDYEFAHVFLYQSTFKWEDFTLQTEEVAGIYKVSLQSFMELCMGSVCDVSCISLKTSMEERIGLTEFVPHSSAYFQQLAEALKVILLAKP